MITPPPLKSGDTVAILTPSTVIRKEYVEGACRFLNKHGFTTRVMPNIRYGDDGATAGSIDERAHDINSAVADAKIRAIWCARGGYGAVEILNKIDYRKLLSDPKWIIGFSDISALHACWHRLGIHSIHATMLRRLAAPEADTNPCVTEVIRLISGANPGINYSFPNHHLNRHGEARGVIIGGNLAVLSDLAGTPYDLLAQVRVKNTILFFEDVAESISRLQRRLWRLYLSGILTEAKALIFGQFTAYLPNADFRTMEEMISTRLTQWGVTCPVVFDFPVGHMPDKNLPLIEGQEVCLEVREDRFSLFTD